MASFIANLNSTPRSTRITAPLSNHRMPHVFVIPPEEEQQDNPPWCCFDADEQSDSSSSDLPSNSDVHLLDVPHHLQQPDRDFLLPPVTRSTSVRHARSRASMLKTLEKRQRPEAIRIIENKPLYTGRGDAREDSDVIEVVKVKRGRDALMDLEEDTKAKRSKTLKARATEALRSIKNVGKGSHRTHVKELWTSSESTPGIFKGMQERVLSQQYPTDHHPPITPIKKGSLSRAASRSLSQIFHPVKRSPPVSSFTLRVGSSVSPIEAQHNSAAERSSSPSHFSCNDANMSIIEVSDTLMTDDALNRPISLSPTMKKKHSLARFSVRELHRLFSFNSSSPHDPSLAPTEAVAPSLVQSGPVSSPNVLPSSNRQNGHMEEDIFADALFLDLDTPERRLASRYHQVSHAHPDEYLSAPDELGDLSFEMRLSSLHFDTLSFDAEDFDVSMEGDFLP